jgi:hypothetical protein
MWFRALFESLNPDNRGRGTSRRTSRRLQLDALEDRTLPSFYAPVSFAAGPNPEAVVTADFNGDGRLDLAVANYSSGTISVLRPARLRRRSGHPPSKFPDRLSTEAGLPFRARCRSGWLAASWPTILILDT